VSNSELTSLESEVLRLLLAGDDPVLTALREQLAMSSVRSRELTGVGFWLFFSTPASVRKLHEQFPVKADFAFGDVAASIESIERGAGFVLFVTEGVLDNLEGYTYDEPWPENVENFRVEYIGGRRDLKKLRSQWSTDVS